MSDAERREPPYVANERDTLLGWLDYHRATLAWKCAGLTADDLVARSVPPSELSLIGLVRHMADVERGWFRVAFAGESLDDLYPYRADEGRDDAFQLLDPNEVDASIGAWRLECQAARTIVAVHSLDDLAPVPFRGHRLSLRWIVTHMIEEYARHNGHADLLRERIDGATGD